MEEDTVVNRRGATGRLFRVPDDRSLARGLSHVLDAGTASHVTLLDRKLHRRASTFPLEIVSCRLNGGSPFSVICKYTGDKDNGRHGHKGGVAYEAAVYRSVLRDCDVSVPRCLGTYEDPDTGWTWLILDYLDNAQTSGEIRNGLARATTWLGRFHALNEGRGETHPELRVYDQQYFAGWVKRTLEFASPYTQELPWLKPLSERFEDSIPIFFERPPTIIHGEFYSKNVLIEDDVAYPVDWEAAALAPGELDLASITESWPQKTVQDCIRRYVGVRWPNGTPSDFERVLDLARAYWLFRWLGDSERKFRKRFAKRIPLLRATAERWGIIPPVS